MPRDKFAAMASRATTDTAEANQSQDQPQVSASARPPRRDKLTALASRNAATPASSSAPAGRRGNKFAAMSSHTAPSVSGDAEATKRKREDEEKAEKLSKIKDRLSKRKKILENLDRAEDLTCKLLEIAHQTTSALQDLSTTQNISALSRTYRETLREIHPLLSTETQDLIRPYQNHSTETKQSMYAARVEMRLAKERTQVLQVFTELAKVERSAKESDRADNALKRVREEEKAAFQN